MIKGYRRLNGLAGAIASAGLALTLIILPELAVAKSSPKSSPNVVLILLDDAGVETVGAYGSEIDTPNIDKLAEEGVLFKNGHATPVCTPSRTRMLTGTHNFRHYTNFMTLDPSAFTVSEFMQKQGYETLVAGKWQLLGTMRDKILKGSRPADAGFMESFVWQVEPLQKGMRYWGPTFEENGRLTRFCNDEFGPDLTNDYTLDFIQRRKDRPFFILYSMLLPHDDLRLETSKWVRTPDSMQAVSTQERFHGMMAYADKLIGNIVSAIDDEGLTENTIIWLLGDNGTHPDIVTRMGNEFIRGGKWTTTDSGTHVPFIIKWPAKLAAGQQLNSLVEIMDVFPTLASALGRAVPAGLDGKNLLPLMIGEVDEVRDAIFMHYAPRQSPSAPPWVHTRFIFDKEYKLYHDGRFYDLEANPNETPTYFYRDRKAAFIAFKKLFELMQDIDDPALPAITSPLDPYERPEALQLNEPARCGDRQPET
tara:strand:- start:1107 stop:2543 length:1437 start_codon:yes stop_codon:yes gene_type:complete